MPSFGPVRILWPVFSLACPLENKLKILF